MSTAFSLTTECIQKFIDVKCLKDVVKIDEDDDEDSDAESDTDHQAEEVLAAWVSDEEDFDISLLDEDKMMSHMLDCYAALCAAQQYRVEMKQPSKLDVNTQQAKNKVFKTAMSLMSTGMTNDGSEKPEFSSAFSKMVTTKRYSDDPEVRVFPDDSKQTDGRGWMPLHWAALAFDTPEGNLHGLAEEDVQLVYANDPLALQRYHHYNEEDVEGQDVEDDCTGIQRYTPVHFLCMQPVTTKRTRLLSYFSICNRQSHFIPSVLHVTCQLGQPTEELLKFLLQLDSSQTAKFYFDNDFNERTPLGHLCNNNSCNERLMTCLLDVDSSTDVVRDGFMACFASSDHANMLMKFDVLSKFVDWDVEESLINRLLHTFLHCRSFSISSSLCIDVIQRFLAIRPNVVKEMYDGCLPVHVAAKSSSMEVMEFLLGLYPESAMIVTVNAHFPYWGGGSSNNLLHVAVSTRNHSTKVGYLCSRYPEMIHQRNGNGKTPLHLALGGDFPSVSTAKILCEVGGQEVVKTPVVHPTASTYTFNGRLPLHFFVQSGLLRVAAPLSEEANFFRSMLRWYPEAAGIAAGGPAYLMSPYQLAVENKLDPYFLRLLLRAVPDLNPAELHRLNYAERRMAMFLAFRAAASFTKPLLMARLRFENKDLVKHVVSFL